MDENVIDLGLFRFRRSLKQIGSVLMDVVADGLERGLWDHDPAQRTCMERLLADIPKDLHVTRQFSAVS